MLPLIVLGLFSVLSVFTRSVLRWLLEKLSGNLGSPSSRRRRARVMKEEVKERPLVTHRLLGHPNTSHSSHMEEVALLLLLQHRKDKGRLNDP